MYLVTVCDRFPYLGPRASRLALPASQASQGTCGIGISLGRQYLWLCVPGPEVWVSARPKHDELGRGLALQCLFGRVLPGTLAGAIWAERASPGVLRRTGQGRFLAA